MRLKNGKKLYNVRGITFFHETERYVNDLNIYNRSKNGTNLWDDLIDIRCLVYRVFREKVDRSLRIYQGWPEDQVLHAS